MRITLFRCPTCTATKRLEDTENREPPNSVPCGYQGCEGRAGRMPNRAQRRARAGRNPKDGRDDAIKRGRVVMRAKDHLARNATGAKPPANP